MRSGSLALFAAALSLWMAGAQAASIIQVHPFSSASEGEALPAGWEPLTFKKIERHTEYRVVKDGGLSVIRATSRQSASGLVSRVSIDLAEYPIMQWRWKVQNVIEKGDVRSKEGDDYAARIYITFEYDPDRASFSKRAKYRLGRLLFGDIPIAALNYIWDNRNPEGTLVDSAYTELSKMIVAESGEANLGAWVTETRDVYRDYLEAFGEEPTRVNSVAIMTDTDNTGEQAVAFYGDILFKRRGEK